MHTAEAIEQNNLFSLMSVCVTVWVRNGGGGSELGLYFTLKYVYSVRIARTLLVFVKMIRIFVNLYTSVYMCCVCVFVSMCRESVMILQNLPFLLNFFTARAYLLFKYILTHLSKWAKHGDAVRWCSSVWKSIYLFNYFAIYLKLMA